MIRPSLTLSALILAGCAKAAPALTPVYGQPLADSGQPDYLGYLIIAASAGIAGYYFGQWRRPEARRYSRPLMLRSVADSVDRLTETKRAEKNFKAWRWAARSFIAAGEMAAKLTGPSGRKLKPLSGRGVKEITGLSLRQQQKFIGLLRVGARDPSDPSRHYPVIRVRASDGAEWLMTPAERRAACDHLEYPITIQPPRFKILDRDIWFEGEAL